MNLIKFGLYGLLVVSLLQTIVYADNSSDESNESSSIPVALKTTGIGLSKSLSNNLIGIGIGYVCSPYRDWDENETHLFPYILYYYKNFFIDGSTIGYTVYSKENSDTGFYINLVGNLSKGGYKTNDSPFFAGMADRNDTAVELGFSTGFITRVGFFEFTAIQDVADAHDGYTANLTYSVPLSDESAAFQFLPYLGATYYSDNYNDYYYGVRETEATSMRLAYQTKGGVNLSAGMGMSYHFNDNWGLFGDLSYQKLNSNIEDSPLIIKDSLTSLFIGVGYSF